MGKCCPEDLVGSLAVAHGALTCSDSGNGIGGGVLRSANGVSFLLLASSAVAGGSPAAYAYRPFDSTDPAVAGPGEFETELSPFSFRRDDSGRTGISPQLRLNYGFAQNWEVVLEGEGEHPPHSRSTLAGNALSLKHVLREGSLQNQLGPSVATELGILLPGVNDESGVGATLVGIVGQEWSWGTLHFNAAATLTRDRRAEVFFGTIIEGPSDWVVRPVAEVLYEREFGAAEVFAALAGVIWQARDNLAFDFAVRQARVDGEPETEVRMGLTFAFSVR